MPQEIGPGQAVVSLSMVAGANLTPLAHQVRHRVVTKVAVLARDLKDPYPLVQGLEGERIQPPRPRAQANPTPARVVRVVARASLTHRHLEVVSKGVGEAKDAAEAERARRTPPPDTRGASLAGSADPAGGADTASEKSEL